MKLGFIGTGVMGTGIIKNFLKNGQEVVVFNRTQAHAQPVIEAGATWAESPHAVAAQCDIVLSMVGFPQDVETIYFGSDGILAGARKGALLIDMTTSTPLWRRKLLLRLPRKACKPLMRRFLVVISAPKMAR